MKKAIKIENLYKEYNLGVIGHGTLYRDLQSFYAKFRGKEDPNTKLGFANTNNSNQTILAINNLSLEIDQGEILGIIGINGAGKSTLLKLLSRVTSPTKGEIKIKGRVASLLEVGTGFHAELTGRENIFLNGSINGLSHKEIKNRLEEIVDFAGVETYLDTPVKRYSSGMVVRLGFAIAAHLDPDILIVDEVLSVGDLSFRKKASSKIKSVSEKGGRTVLFVSHNMDSIKSLCSKTILISKGSLVNYGKTNEIVNEYITGINKANSLNEGQINWSKKDAPENDNIKLINIKTYDESMNIKSDFNINEDVFLEIEYKLKTNDLQIASSIELTNESGNLLFAAQDDYSHGEWGKQTPKRKGIIKTIFKFQKNLFHEGVIFIGLNIYLPPGAANTTYQIKERNILSFRIIDNYHIDSARGTYPYPWGSPALRPKIEVKSYFKTT